MQGFRLADPETVRTSRAPIWRYLTDVVALVPSLLPLVEARFALLPVDQTVRDDVLIWAIITSAVAAFGGYRSLCPYRFGWTALFLFVLSLNGLWAITTAGFGFSLQVQFLLERLGYLSLFLFLGLAVGVFLRAEARSA